MSYHPYQYVGREKKQTRKTIRIFPFTWINAFMLFGKQFSSNVNNKENVHING